MRTQGDASLLNIPVISARAATRLNGVDHFLSSSVANETASSITCDNHRSRKTPPQALLLLTWLALFCAGLLCYAVLSTK